MKRSQAYIGMLVTHKDSCSVYRVDWISHEEEDLIRVSLRSPRGAFVKMHGEYIVGQFSPHYDLDSFPNQAPL